MSCYTYIIILKLHFWLKYNNGLAVMRKTTKLMEGGHRCLQESMGILLLRFLYVFNVFQNPKSRAFLPRDALWCKARYCDRMSSVCL